MQLFTPSTAQYRADIDGLRALAVLAVVVFHFSAYWLPNGFLGVDVFFVLSGYLITSVIYRERLEGRFSFSQFYIRRIKRILPAFFVVLAFGLTAAYLLFLPQDYLEVKRSALAAMLFGANIFFTSLQEGYFASATDQKPFLQLWSLAVEEQFYFIFPILLFGLQRLSQRSSQWPSKITNTRGGGGHFATPYATYLQFAQWAA